MFVIYAVATTCRIVHLLHWVNTTILVRAYIVFAKKNTSGPAMACCYLKNYKMDVYHFSTVSYCKIIIIGPMCAFARVCLELLVVR